MADLPPKGGLYRIVRENDKEILSEEVMKSLSS